MNTFFIADMHLSHKNVIEYSNRPFTDVHEMDEALIQNWNSAVSHGDTVYILGDFSFAGRTKTEEYLKRLKGNKRMIKGNHDSWLSNKNCMKYLEWVKDYYEIKEHGQNYVLCHYPIYSWNKRSYGGVHLHGHTHKDIFLDYTDIKSDADDPGPKIYNRYLCVSVECINYTPISLEEVKRRFNIVYG